MGSDELEASVEAVAVVSEGGAELLCESVAESPMLTPPVSSSEEEATNITSSINFGHSGLRRH